LPLLAWHTNRHELQKNTSASGMNGSFVVVRHKQAPRMLVAAPQVPTSKPHMCAIIIAASCSNLNASRPGTEIGGALGADGVKYACMLPEGDWRLLCLSRAMQHCGTSDPTNFYTLQGHLHEKLPRTGMNPSNILDTMLRRMLPRVLLLWWPKRQAVWLEKAHLVPSLLSMREMVTLFEKSTASSEPIMYTPDLQLTISAFIIGDTVATVDHVTPPSSDPIT
jgi:hypothetical protein